MYTLPLLRTSNINPDSPAATLVSYPQHYSLGLGVIASQITPGGLTPAPIPALTLTLHMPGAALPVVGNDVGEAHPVSVHDALPPYRLLQGLDSSLSPSLSPNPVPKHNGLGEIRI